MNLLGRMREVETLERDFRKEESQFLAVYGRRRVGKTYLIREYFRPESVKVRARSAGNRPRLPHSGGEMYQIAA